MNNINNDKNKLIALNIGGNNIFYQIQLLCNTQKILLYRYSKQ